MSARFISTLAICLFGTLLGCDKGGARSGDPASLGVALAPAASPTSHAKTERRQLALAPVRGEGPADRALASARTAAERDDATAEAWVLLALGWVRKARSSGDPGYYLSAEAAADIALDLSPGFRPALGIKGLALLNAHRFKAARKLAEEVLAGDPDDLTALGVLSDALLELGDVSAASQTVQKFMDLKPSLPAYTRASYLRWLTGDTKEAKALIRLAIDSGRGARDPEPTAWAVVQAALIFWHEGDWEGAEAGFDEALRRLPGYAPALVGKARVALARDKAPEAAAMLAQAVAATPTVEALGLLVQARAQAGDAAGAAQAKRRLLEEGRRSDRLGLAGYLAARNEDIPQALALLEAERKERSGVYLEDSYAWALYRAGRLAEARAASDRARVYGTPDPVLQFHAGAILLAHGEGQEREGRDLLRRALAQNSHFDLAGAAEARSLLARTGTTLTAERPRKERSR